MTQRNDIPVLVIFGPTASGKTALAGSLFASGSDEYQTAHTLDFFRGKAEIISADSMQVYRGMDIGTAKPDAAFLNTLPHHLINVCNPDEQFCAGDFVRLADIACAEIYGRGKLPVILGGTAFYIRNFLYGLPQTPESDPVTRELLRERMRCEGSQTLYRELQVLDPQSAARIHINDEYRILRSLEVCITSSRTQSSFGLPTCFRSGYRFIVISLDRNRSELYSRIDMRVVSMFEAGLENEFRSLQEAGYSSTDPGMQAIGYREFYTADSLCYDANRICADIQHNSRKYAKRQETFIRSIPEVLHVAADDYLSIYTAVLDGFKQFVHT